MIKAINLNLLKCQLKAENFYFETLPTVAKGKITITQNEYLLKMATIKNVQNTYYIWLCMLMHMNAYILIIIIMMMISKMRIHNYALSSIILVHTHIHFIHTHPCTYAYSNTLSPQSSAMQIKDRYNLRVFFFQVLMVLL